MAEIASAAVEGSRSIGRYFTIISLVPSLLFVLYIYALVEAGAWSGSFQPGKALRAAESLGFRGIAALVLAALLLGLVLHPFQFSMTQFLEGYWGNSPIGRQMARWRIIHYRRVAKDLSDEADCEGETWRQAIEADRTTPERADREAPEVRKRRNNLRLDTPHGEPFLAHYLRAQAAHAARARYPKAGRRIMPTRLGNVLRRYEETVGVQYALDVLRIAPHLNLVARKEHREYVADCRKGLDLGVRICVLFALATLVSVGLLIHDGPWLLLALAPYLVSYLAYRGAISSAQAYGTALRTMIDLDRFALYDQLHVPAPSDTSVERDHNVRLMKLLSGEQPYLLYTQPPPTDPSNPT
jgi:hypothetical protein